MDDSISKPHVLSRLFRTDGLSWQQTLTKTPRYVLGSPVHTVQIRSEARRRALGRRGRHRAEEQDGRQEPRSRQARRGRRWKGHRPSLSSAPWGARLRSPAETYPPRSRHKSQTEPKTRRPNSATSRHAGLTAQPKHGPVCTGTWQPRSSRSQVVIGAESPDRLEPPGQHLHQHESRAQSWPRTGSDRRLHLEPPPPPTVCRALPALACPGHHQAGRRETRGCRHTPSEMLTPRLSGSCGHVLVCRDLSPGRFSSPSPTRSPGV